MVDRVGQQLGNYRLLRLLGQGGQASVYLGEHIHLKSQAAVKVLRVALAEEEQTAFFQEAQTLARLSHPHIVRVLDFALQDGLPFLVMEYAAQGTLRQCHPRGTRPPLDVILSSLPRRAQRGHSEGQKSTGIDLFLPESNVHHALIWRQNGAAGHTRSHSAESWSRLQCMTSLFS